MNCLCNLPVGTHVVSINFTSITRVPSRRKEWSRRRVRPRPSRGGRFSVLRRHGNREILTKEPLQVPGLDPPRALQLRGERKRVQRDGMREDDDCRRAARGKRAELERFLGDILAKEGSCGAALLAYKRALKQGVSEEARSAIGRSIRSCGGP